MEPPPELAPEGESEETSEGEEEDSSPLYEPVGRRGACSFVYNDKFYLYQVCQECYWPV